MADFDPVLDRYSLKPEDIVIRGCQRERPERLIESMRQHYLSPALRTLWSGGEWGLSVAAFPNGTEASILKAARHMRQSHYRVAPAGAIREVGEDLLDVPFDAMSSHDVLRVVWDHNAHGLILNSREPTMELAAAIAEAFGAPRTNPYYEERSRRRASR